MNKQAKIIVCMALLSCGAVEAAAQKTVSVTQLTENPQTCRKVEFDIALEGNIANPYDAREITLDMHIQAPGNKTYILPCYFDNGIWKARFSPMEAGIHNCQAVLKTAKKTAKSKKQEFLVADSGKSGFIRLHGNWSFRHDDGTLFRGIGENIGWDPRPGDRWGAQYTYEHLIPKLSKSGVNFVRMWFRSTRLPVEYSYPGSPDIIPDEWKGLAYPPVSEKGEKSKADRLDEIIALMEANNVAVMPALDDHNMLINWEKHPYNKINGGPCNTAADFFTSEEAKERYKNRLRYIVARWGYSTSIACWELWNEVDNAQYGGGHASTPAIPSEAVCRWHKEMAACLKSIDPYRHLVSTSISHREVKGMYELDELDINQMHVYRNTAKMPGIIERNTELYGKPFVIGEFAWDWDWRNVWHSVGFAFDFELRRGLWEGLFTATPILPMSWWWEFLDQREMEWIFKPVREISDRMLSESKGDIVKINSITSHKDLTVSAIKAAESLYVYAVNPTYNRVGSSEIVFENLDFEGENFKVERYDMRTQRAEIMNMTLHSEGNKSVLSPVAVTPWDDRLYIITPVPKGWKPLNAVEEIEPF